MGDVGNTSTTEGFVRVPFAFGSGAPEVDAAQQQAIASLVKIATAEKQHVLVTGHADAKGTPAANERVALKRAQALAQLLAAAGLPSELMQIEGRSNREPARSENTPEADAVNRRAEAVLAP